MAGLDRPPWQWISAGIGAVALLAACSASAAKPGGTATVPSDPWAVPAVITVPYVNRVLAELNHIDGDALRSARAANAITPQFAALERSIYANEVNYQLSVAVVTKSLANNWQNIRSTPGDVVTNVIELIFVHPTCLYAHATEDFRAQGPGGIGLTNKWWVALVPKTATATNPTRWAYIYNGYDSTGGAPKDACAGN